MTLRIEDNALLTGAGCYIDDEQAAPLAPVAPAQMAHMAILRSPIAHGRIVELRTEAARAMPGVLTVLTADELKENAVATLRCRAMVTDIDGQPMREPERPVLATGKVVYVGQPIAAIIAATELQALDALEQITFEIDDLPVVTDVLQAGDAPAIWPYLNGTENAAQSAPSPAGDLATNNLAFHWQHGNADVTRAAFDAADHIVELTVHHPRIAISPIETRGCVAQFSAAQNNYQLITPSQGVMSLRAALSETLGIDPTNLRVITRDVGGSFAVKIWPYPEHVLALLAARLTGQAVKWICSRTDSFGADIMGRARVDHARLALSKEGKFQALRIDTYADMGAFLNTASPAIVTEASVRTLGHVYKIPGLLFDVHAMFTNKIPTDAYRGAGKPESVSTFERLIDVAAADLGFDRFELREKNLLQPSDIPYETPVGVIYDAGDFPSIAQKIRAASHWDDAFSRKQRSKDKGLLRGIGLGFYLHVTGGSPEERSEVRALPDGTVLVRTGTQDTGQGHRTALALVAAEALELPVSAIRVEQGDSAWLDKGGGTGGSNLMTIAGNSVHRTAHTMLDQARHIASELLESATDDLVYRAGSFTITGTDRSVTLAQIAVGYDNLPATQRAPAMGAGCVAQCDFQGIHATAPNGAYVCEVDIDPATGQVTVASFIGVDDLGRVFNPQTTEGQLHGGIAQAVGEVLMEGMHYDEQGQIINGSLMDYALPRASDIPLMQMSLAGTGSPNSALGVKGVGEVSSIGAPGAIMNAVHDALAAYKVRHLDIPLTPLVIWQAINTRRP